MVLTKGDIIIQYGREDASRKKENINDKENINKFAIKINTELNNDDNYDLIQKISDSFNVDYKSISHISIDLKGNKDYFVIEKNTFNIDDELKVLKRSIEQDVKYNFYDIEELEIDNVFAGMTLQLFFAFQEQNQEDIIYYKKSELLNAAELDESLDIDENYELAIELLKAQGLHLIDILLELDHNIYKLDWNNLYQTTLDLGIDEFDEINTLEKLPSEIKNLIIDAKKKYGSKSEEIINQLKQISHDISSKNISLDM